MNPSIGLTQGFREITAHRLRSTIAMMSIVLGAGSLLATFALTEGIARQERAFLKSLGGVEKIDIRDAPVPEEQAEMAEVSRGLTERDVAALRESPEVIAASPAHRLRNPALRFGKIVSFDARLIGGNPDYAIIYRQTLATGRNLSALDMARHRTVVVLGAAVLPILGLTPQSAVGQKISLSGVLFEVIGTLEPTLATWMDKQMLIPYSTAFTIFESGKVDATGVSAPVERFNGLVVTLRDPEHLENVIKKIKPILLKTHRGIEDFGFDTRLDWADNIELRIAAVRVSGSVIAAVSLLVGGIGVTNVMLAAIKQRIREIGVRRAIGAHRSDIFMQVMLEAFILACMGGVLGLAVGWGIVAFFKVASLSKAIPIIVPAAVLWSLLSALATGILAGIYPAFRGAAMSPMEALRYE